VSQAGGGAGVGMQRGGREMRHEVLVEISPASLSLLNLRLLVSEPSPLCVGGDKSWGRSAILCSGPPEGSFVL
jgi:hypothetical protein